MACIKACYGSKATLLPRNDPPRASNALVLGTYGQGMRMKTSSPKTWRREVLESHLGGGCHVARHHHEGICTGKDTTTD